MMRVSDSALCASWICHPYKVMVTSGREKHSDKLCFEGGCHPNRPEGTGLHPTKKAPGPQRLAPQPRIREVNLRTWFFLSDLPI